MQRVEPYLNTEQGYEKLLIQNQNAGDILQSYQKEEIPRYFKMNGRIFNTEEYPELANVLNTIGYQDTGIEVHEYPFYKNDIFYYSISNTEMHIITRTQSSREMHAFKIFLQEKDCFLM